MKPTEIIANLSDSRVEALLEPCFSDIDTVAAFLGIDEGYLSVQVRLLLPQYSEESLLDRDETLTVREVLSKLRDALGDFEQFYKSHRARNGIDDLASGLKLKGRRTNLRLIDPQGGAEDVPIRYGEVPASDGLEIQNQIHYIHNARSDTLLHRGLFIEDRDFPLCYAAISACDRNYQRSALQESLGLDIPIHRIAVMTRAYGYSPLPKNMMSKLFDLTANEIASGSDFDYIVTALNPFLGFTGSIFLGASYVPFARSPMVYRYTSEGLYANRRRASDKVQQQYSTPPIVWLVRDLRNSAPGAWCGKLVDIQRGQYENG